MATSIYIPTNSTRLHQFLNTLPLIIFNKEHLFDNKNNKWFKKRVETFRFRTQQKKKKKSLEFDLF